MYIFYSYVCLYDITVYLGYWRKYWDLFLLSRIEVSAKQLWEIRNSSCYFSMWKQLQECSILELLQFPVEWQVVTSAHGKYTLKYIRGIIRWCCPLWKLHEFQNCRFWWEGVCSNEGEKNIFCLLPKQQEEDKGKGWENGKWLTNGVMPLQFWQECKGCWKTSQLPGSLFQRNSYLLTTIQTAIETLNLSSRKRLLNT